MLARADCDVFIVGQQKEKGIRACHELRELSENPSVHFIQSDLSLVQGANGLADEVIRRWPHLSYLVHCAGIVRGKRVLTPEGLESNFAVNYERFVPRRDCFPLTCFESHRRCSYPLVMVLRQRGRSISTT
jgi:NAD(P)-dependent dehydrogenase (short-subunit alcohol dehydrogenase family)